MFGKMLPSSRDITGEGHLAWSKVDLNSCLKRNPVCVCLRLSRERSERAANTKSQTYTIVWVVLFLKDVPKFSWPANTRSWSGPRAPSSSHWGWLTFGTAHRMPRFAGCWKLSADFGDTKTRVTSNHWAVVVAEISANHTFQPEAAGLCRHPLSDIAGFQLAQWNPSIA